MDNISTVFVTLSDKKYFDRALKTIRQLRTIGKWEGIIIWITIDFDLEEEIKLKYTIIEKKFQPINKSILLDKIGNGFTDGDKREINKLNQWEKLHLFDEYFKQWKRIVFLDAGLNVFDSVHYLLELDFENKFLCGNDRGDGFIKHNNNEFSVQLSNDNPDIIEKLVNDFDAKINLKSDYFLNCMWVFDSSILDYVKKEEFIKIMNKYPIFKSNEMGVMNVILHYKYNIWIPFPEKTTHGKYLFDWCELNRPGTNWNQYCFIKYSSQNNEGFFS